MQLSLFYDRLQNGRILQFILVFKIKFGFHSDCNEVFLPSKRCGVKFVGVSFLLKQTNQTSFFIGIGMLMSTYC